MPDSATEPTPLWTLDDVGRRLGKSKRTVQRYIQKRGLPYRRIGGELRFIPHEIESWVAAQPGRAF